MLHICPGWLVSVSPLSHVIIFINLTSPALALLGSFESRWSIIQTHVCSSLLHLAVFSPSNDMHQVSMDQLGIWLMAQLAIAVICTCLPTYGPFLLGGAFLSKNLQGWYTSIVSLLGRVRGSSHLGSKTGTHPASDAPSWPHDNHYRRFSDTGDRVVLTRVVGGGNDPYDRKVPEQDYKMDGIKIRSEVEIA